MINSQKHHECVKWVIPHSKSKAKFWTFKILETCTHLKIWDDPVKDDRVYLWERERERERETVSVWSRAGPSLRRVRQLP